MLFLKCENYGGVDWHDSSTHIKYLSKREDMSIEKEDILTLIIDDIVNTYKYLDRKEIEEVILNHQKKTFRGKTNDDNGNLVDAEVWTNDDNEEFYETSISVDATGILENATMDKKDDIKVYYETWWGQYSDTTYYYLKEYKDENVRYLCLENFYAYSKGVSLIERFYHEPFETFAAAKEYFDTMEVHKFDFITGDKTIIPFDMSMEDTNTNWYKNNMAAINLMRDYNISLYDETFEVFVQSHLKNLCKKIEDNVDMKSYVVYSIPCNDIDYETELFDKSAAFDMNYNDIVDYYKKTHNIESDKRYLVNDKDVKVIINGKLIN